MIQLLEKELVLNSFLKTDMIKVALVDDHVVLRKSLAILLGMLKHFEVVLEANNGKEFIDSIDVNNLPDVVLMDVTMPVMDGLETTKYLKMNNINIKVIALSMMKNDMIVIRMLKNGAKGYLLKDCEPSELQQCILDVYNKGYYFNEFFNGSWKNNMNADIKPADMMFNEKELAFLQLCCSEKSYKEIAEDMNVSPRTVDGYRDALFEKLGATSRVGLVLYAIKNDIVKI